MYRRFALSLALALLCFGECVVKQPKKHSRVTVTAFSASGGLLQNVGVDLFQIGTKRSWRSAFHNATAKVPYGTYTLRVDAPGFRAIERELRVDQAEVVARVQLEVSVECGDSAELGGTVQHAPVGRELWVKLVPVIGSGGIETPLKPNGTFLLGGLDSGAYFLLVVDGKEILYTTTVQNFGGKRISLDLGKH